MKIFSSDRRYWHPATYPHALFVCFIYKHPVGRSMDKGILDEPRLRIRIWRWQTYVRLPKFFEFVYSGDAA